MDIKGYYLFGIFLSVILSVNTKSAFDTDLYESVLDSAQCDRQLRFLANDSLGLQFVDASAKPPSGISKGNWNDLGDYHQCLDINTVKEGMGFQGKYCMITVPLNQGWIKDRPEDWPENWPEDWPQDWPEDWPENWPDDWPSFPWPTPKKETPEQRIFPVLIAGQNSMALALCIPKVCSIEEAIKFIENTTVILDLEYNPYFCRLPNDKPLVAADYTAFAVFGILGLILLASTSYDLYQQFVLKQDPSRKNVLLTSFSIYTNTQRFLTFNTSPGALECIDGIRAISMFWVIIGHTYCMSLLGFVHNLEYTINWMRKLSSVWITSAPIVVDTFFLISGILVVYTTIGKISRVRFVRTIHLFILNRLLRMFPLLAAVILLQASIFNYVSDGPYWLNVAHATESCRKYWWSALLHIQNYVNPIDLCLVHSWYLSVDTQLYVICPIVLFFLFGRELTAWIALTAFLFLALLSSSLYSFLSNYSAAIGNTRRLLEFSEYVQYYYVNTLTRAPPFVIGMLYGYQLYLFRDKDFRISKFNVIVLWSLSFLLMAFCIFSMYPVMQPDHTAQVFDNFLNAYMRALWAVSLGWLIFACVKGYGGPINWFLTLNVWKLPARMSYAMYLIHLPIIMVANGSWLKTYYFTDGLNFYRYFGDVCLAFIFAFVLSITVDAPFSTLQKLLNGGGKKPRPKPVVVEPSTPRRTVDEYYVKTAL